MTPISNNSNKTMGYKGLSPTTGTQTLKDSSSQYFPLEPLVREEMDSKFAKFSENDFKQKVADFYNIIKTKSNLTADHYKEMFTSLMVKIMRDLLENSELNVVSILKLLPTVPPDKENFIIEISNILLKENDAQAEVYELFSKNSIQFLEAKGFCGESVKILLVHFILQEAMKVKDNFGNKSGEVPMVEYMSSSKKTTSHSNEYQNLTTEKKQQFRRNSRTKLFDQLKNLLKEMDKNLEQYSKSPIFIESKNLLVAIINIFENMNSNKFGFIKMPLYATYFNSAGKSFNKINREILEYLKTNSNAKEYRKNNHIVGEIVKRIYLILNNLLHNDSDYSLSKIFDLDFVRKYENWIFSSDICQILNEIANSNEKYFLAITSFIASGETVSPFKELFSSCLEYFSLEYNLNLISKDFTQYQNMEKIIERSLTKGLLLLTKNY